MKKLIAIAVVFALVMGGVFAETTVSGSVDGTVVLASGKTDQDDIITAGSGGLKFTLAGKNEEGNFGGELSFEGNVNKDTWSAAAGSGLKNLRSNVWWKPIDMLKIRINGGGYDIGKAGTGIYLGDVQFKNYSEATTVGSGEGTGLYLEVKPIDGLEVDLVIPFGRGVPSYEFTDTLKQFYAKIAYVIPNIGKVQAGFKSDTFEYTKPAQIGLAFDLSMIPNFTLGLNAITKFPSADNDSSSATEGYVKTSQLEMGLAIGYTMADFNVKLSLAGKFLGKTVNADGDIITKEAAQFAVGLWPNYTLGALKAGLGVDVLIKNIGMAGDESYNNTYGAIVYWQASPQVQYTVGKGTLKTGLAIGSLDDVVAPLPLGPLGKIQWKIPVRLSFSL